MNPLITIAIPVVDRFDYLKQAVTSALAQTYLPIEIIIGQDSGPRGVNREVQDWCRSLSAENHLVRYQCNSRPLGLAANWNALIDAARGEFLTILADDDRLLPDFLDKTVRVIEKNTGVVFCNHYIIDSRGVRLEKESLSYTQHYRRNLISAGKVGNPEKWVWQNAVPICTSLIRTSEAEKLHFKDYLNTPEIELFIRLAQSGFDFVFVPDYLSEYLIHEKSTQSKIGLWNERLANCLLPVPVKPEIEPFKREFLSHLMVNAVNRSLRQGQWKQAREFFQSGYYPDSQRRRPIGLIHSLLTRLAR